MEDTANAILVGIAMAAARVLNAPLDIVKVAIEKNAAMFGEIEIPIVSKKHASVFSRHPNLLAKCKVEPLSGGSAIEISKVAKGKTPNLGENYHDFKILIRCAKPGIKKTRNNGVNFQKKFALGA